MKKSILLILSMFMLLSMQAQKAKLQNVGFTYINYPMSPLSINIKTYSVNVSNTSTRVKIGEDREREYFVLEGFEKVSPDKADIMLNFELYGVQTNADVFSKEEVTKVDGKDVKKVYYYHQVTSTSTAKFTIVDKAGNVILNKPMQGKDYENISKSNLFNTKGEAEADFNKNKAALISNSDNTAIENVMLAIKNYINNQYGYFKVNASATIATGKGKDAEYADADEALEKFKEAAVLYNAGNQEGYNKIARECIAIWEKMLEEYNPDNKKARISKKNADSFFYNISSAYLYMNEFDKAIEYINKGLEVDNSIFIKASIPDIKDRKVRYEKNQAREQGKI